MERNNEESSGLTMAQARMIAQMVTREVKRILEKREAARRAEVHEDYMTTREAAEYLGWPLKTVYNKIEELPHVKKGKRNYFTKSSLNAYITGI